MGFFDVIPTRRNGKYVWASWFNSLRDAGAALEALSPQPDVQIVIPNNSGGAVGTGIFLDSSEYVGYIVRLTAYRKTDSNHKRGMVMLYCAFKDGTGWLPPERQQTNEPLGITFSVDPSTQELMMNTNDLVGASYEGKGTGRIIDRSKLEV